MALGGSTFEETLPSNATTEVYDEAQPGLGWQAAPRMNIGRGHANTVLLPDGSMVEVGGGVGRDNTFASPLHAADDEQKQVELWDPETGQWRLGPAQAENRAYHSTALLLPDGRVMSAGDEWHGADGRGGHRRRGQRHGGDLRAALPLQGPAAHDLVGARDHQGGRGLRRRDPRLQRDQGGSGGPRVGHPRRGHEPAADSARADEAHGLRGPVAPPNANAAPPGYYMLFLLNDQGVPSMAKFVKLTTGGTAPAECPDARTRRIRPDPPDPPRSAGSARIPRSRP